MAVYDSLLDTAEEEFSKQQAELAARVTPIKRPCAPGDVVYLENGKPYVVQDIGEADILVQDQDFPLFSRTIDRENFSRLLGRDDRNADLQVLPLPDAVQEQPQPEESTAAVQPESQEESEDFPFVEQVMADTKALSEPHDYQPINYVAPYRPTVPGTPKEKFAANMEAIRTLKKVEQRVARGMAPANEDEQKILAQYSGWGGLADAFDPNKSSWSQEYRDLKAILTESEYQAARSSTLTAYFTPPEVIHTMYRALERMGVRGGNILEPSMGTGAFFAHKPSSFDLHSAKLYGVELDELTGRIARQLYQKARIQITGFEKADLPDSFFDCAVGNVPFGDFSVSDRAYDKLHFRIHDYFLAKTIDKVRTGGIIAMITTSGTMDKKSDTVRKYIAARCDLIGAVRLPNTTFKRNAGTEAVADILFLQKRDRLVERDEAWLHIGQTEDGIPINQYFVEHPEMVCGTIKMVSGPYGPAPTCEPSSEGTLEEQLDRAMSHLSATLTKPEIAIEAAEEQDADVIEADPDVRNFSYTLKDGKIYFRTNSVMKEMRLGATADNRVRQLIALRDTVRELLQAQLDDLPDAEIHRLQTQLKKQYDTARWGNVKALDEKYRNRKNPSNNFIFTQHIQMGTDSFRHQHNLNVMVIGGSGSGKTRYYVKPNLLQCECSYIILDSKGEISRDLGGMFEAQGIAVTVIDLVHFRGHYNPLVYLENDEDAIKLAHAIVHNTKPKDAVGSADKFWDDSSMMLLSAIILYLLYEAPVEEQNLSTVMYMIINGQVSEDDSYPAPLAMLFSELEEKDPDHPAVLQYTAMPYGLRRIANLRAMTTKGVASLIPFNTQEVLVPGGIYYGVNAISGNLIIALRTVLINGNAMVIATSGGGKSLFVKQEILELFLRFPNAKFYIVDPENEYSPLVCELGGLVVDIAVDSTTYFNPLDFTYDPVTKILPHVAKAEFVLSLCEQVMAKDGLKAGDKSLIDRSLKNIYKPLVQSGYTIPCPTLTDLYNDLKAQPSERAHRIALALELFATGSMNMFAHPTNVDMSNRLVCFNIQSLGEQLKRVAMLSMLEYINTCVMGNERNDPKAATWVYFDEIYLLLRDQLSSEFLYTSWKRFRKYNAYATGITQNVQD